MGKSEHTDILIKKKEKEPSAVQEFMSDIFTDLLEEPIVLVPMLCVGIVLFPFILIKENKTKKRLIKEYGHTKYKIEEFDNINSLSDYLWTVRCEFNTKCTEVNNKDFYENNGFLDEYNIEKEMQTLEQDKQTTEFIRWHMNGILRLDCRDSLDEVLKLLNGKYFDSANNYIKEHTV